MFYSWLISHSHLLSHEEYKGRPRRVGKKFKITLEQHEKSVSKVCKFPVDTFFKLQTFFEKVFMLLEFQCGGVCAKKNETEQMLIKAFSLLFSLLVGILKLSLNPRRCRRRGGKSIKTPSEIESHKNSKEIFSVSHLVESK